MTEVRGDSARIGCPVCGALVRMKVGDQFPDQLEIVTHFYPVRREICKGSGRIVGSRIVPTSA